MTLRCDLSVTTQVTHASVTLRLSRSRNQSPITLIPTRGHRTLDAFKTDLSSSPRPADRLSESFAPSQYATLEVWFESVAQLVEHRPFKALVLGSSPSALTIKHPINIGDIDASLYVRQLLKFTDGYFLDTFVPATGAFLCTKRGHPAMGCPFFAVRLRLIWIRRTLPVCRNWAASSSPFSVPPCRHPS